MLDVFHFRPRLPVHHLRSPTPSLSPYLLLRVDTPTLVILPLRRLLTPLPVQTCDQDRCQHHCGRHPGEHTMSRTRHQISMMERATLNLRPPMFRPRRENGYGRKRKKSLAFRGAHPHPTDLFHPFPRMRFWASLRA